MASLTFSILGGSRTAAAYSTNPLPITRTYYFQYPRRIENGCGQGYALLRVRPPALSVSSADRERLRHGCWVVVEKRLKNFQYPRRIENGCGAEEILGYEYDKIFQYPRRIENGCGRTRQPASRPHPPLSVSSADRERLRQYKTSMTNPPFPPTFSILGGSRTAAAFLPSFTFP